MLPSRLAQRARVRSPSFAFRSAEYTVSVNVVEKIITNGSQAESKAIIDERVLISQIMR